jgi:hypothetical protein
VCGQCKQLPQQAGVSDDATHASGRITQPARASLVASSERDAVEIALDLVNLRNELVRGTRALLGVKLSRVD